jgi:hypothetical protein
MPEVTIRHSFECDEDTFWDKCVFDPEFLRRLYTEALKFPGYKLLEQQDGSDKLTRRVHVDPPVANLPAPLKKIAGDKLSYVEDGVFDKKTKRYSFKCIASVMPDKTKNVGEMWVEKRADGTIERVTHVTVEVKVFMIGHLIEERIIADIKRSYDRSAEFTRQYLKELRAK